MTILEKSAAEISEADLRQLVADEVAESFYVDYKRDLNFKTPGDRKEFAKDVSGFANSRGGYLFYGIEEDPDRSGIPLAVPGIALDDPDKTIQSLESVLQNRIDPRIDNIEIAATPLDGGTFVVCVKTPLSWSRPHMVDYRFYGRSSTATSPLDVTQVRGLYTLSHEVSRQAREFHLSRLEKIRADRWTMPLDLNGQFIFHVIPFRAFEPGVAVKVPGKSGRWTRLAPPGSSGGLHRRHNADGLAVWAIRADGLAKSGTQWFRNGIIEVIAPSGCRRYDGEEIVSGQIFESCLLEDMRKLIATGIDLGSQPPFLLLISGFGLAKRKLITGGYFFDDEAGFDRDVVRLPEALITNLNDFDVTMKHVVDAFWQAGDYENSPYYKGGRWQGGG